MGVKERERDADIIETSSRNKATVSRFTPHDTGGGQSESPALGRPEFGHQQ